MARCLFLARCGSGGKWGLVRASASCVAVGVKREECAPAEEKEKSRHCDRRHHAGGRS